MTAAINLNLMLKRKYLNENLVILQHNGNRKFRYFFFCMLNEQDLKNPDKYLFS